MCRAGVAEEAALVRCSPPMAEYHRRHLTSPGEGSSWRHPGSWVRGGATAAPCGGFKHGRFPARPGTCLLRTEGGRPTESRRAADDFRRPRAGHTKPLRLPKLRQTNLRRRAQPWTPGSTRPADLRAILVLPALGGRMARVLMPLRGLRRQHHRRAGLFAGLSREESRGAQAQRPGGF